MASANVEIVKRFIDAYNRRDVEALAGLVTPDFEFFAAMIGVVEGGSYRGREGMLQGHRRHLGGAPRAR